MKWYIFLSVQKLQQIAPLKQKLRWEVGLLNTFLEGKAELGANTAGCRGAHWRLVEAGDEGGAGGIGGVHDVGEGRVWRAGIARGFFCQKEKNQNSNDGHVPLLLRPQGRENFCDMLAKLSCHVSLTPYLWCTFCFLLETYLAALTWKKRPPLDLFTVMKQLSG